MSERNTAFYVRFVCGRRTDQTVTRERFNTPLRISYLLGTGLLSDRNGGM